MDYRSFSRRLLLPLFLMALLALPIGPASASPAAASPAAAEDAPDWIDFSSLGDATTSSPQTCFCCTPKRSVGSATGKTKRSGGRQSEVSIRLRKPGGARVSARVEPKAGESCTSIMTKLRDQVRAAGCTAGDVDTNANGRAVFCIKGRGTSLGSKETDYGIKEVTYATLSYPSAGFLRGVGKAFLAAAVAGGGGVTMEVHTGEADGDVVAVTVETFKGQGGEEINEALVAALNDNGFEAWISHYVFDEEIGEEPAIFIDPGAYEQVVGVGMTSEDEELTETAVGGFQPGELVIDVDLDGDGQITGEDFRHLLAMIDAGDRRVDYNRDGRVDSEDLLRLFDDLRSPLLLEAPAVGDHMIRPVFEP